MVDQVKAVEQAIEQMESANQAHEKRAAARMGMAEVVIAGPSLTERIVEEIRQGRRAEAKLEVEKWGADHAERIADLRSEGREKLEAARAAMETEYYKTIAEAGPKGAEWQEAEARAAFVREDLQRQSGPADVVELYQTALAAGDKTGAWLYGRYGSEHLAALAKSTDMGTAARAQMALGELEHLAWSGAVAARRDAERKLAELGRKLEAPVTRGERLEEAADWADRLGMSQSPAELVDSGIIDSAKRFEGVAFTAPVPA